MPLILENCQLELINDEFGTKYTTTYNIGLLEKKVCIIKCIIVCNVCDKYTEILLLFVISFYYQYTVIPHLYELIRSSM